MVDERVEALVEQAVAQRYALWARQHPSLASVIDRLTLTEQACQSLRAAPAYHRAVDAYRRARDEQALLEDLTSLAGTVLSILLR